MISKVSFRDCVAVEPPGLQEPGGWALVGASPCSGSDRRAGDPADEAREYLMPPNYHQLPHRALRNESKKISTLIRNPFGFLILALRHEHFNERLAAFGESRTDRVACCRRFVGTT